MTETTGQKCDGCGSICKNIQGEYLKSVAYINIKEISRTGRGGKRKYHLCKSDCITIEFDVGDDGKDVDVTWSYSLDEERIVGANWFRYQPYVSDPDTGECEREDFPDDIEEMAQKIEDLIYDE